MGIADLISEKEVNPGLAPVQYSDTGYLDIIKKSARDQYANMNLSSADALRHEVMNESAIKYQALTGENLYSQQGGEYMIDLWKRRVDQTVIQARLEGKEGWNDVHTSDEIDELARQRARDARIDYDSAMQRAGVDHPKIASFVGAVGGWAQDPLQVLGTLYTSEAALATGATKMIAARAGGGIRGIAAAEGVVNAAQQAVVEPAVLKWQKEVGHDYTWKDSVMNTLFAGATGAGVTAGILGFGKLTAGFNGFTPEQVQKIMDFAKIESKNKKPVEVVDVNTAKAVDGNMAAAMEDFSQFKMPDPKKLDPRGNPKIFNEDAVTYDHGQVAEKFLTSGKKASEFDRFSRKEFIDAMKKEYAIDNSLPRADLGMAKKAAEEAQAARVVAAKADDEAQKILNVLSRQKINGEEELARLADADKAAKRARIAHIDSVKAERAALNRLRAASRSMESDEILKRLNDGEIPLALEGRYKTYKKNAKKAYDDMVEYRKQLVDASNKIIEGAGRYGTESPTIDVIKQSVSPESISRTKALDDFSEKQLVSKILTDEKFANQSITIADENGNPVNVKMKDLPEELDNDKELVEQVKACAGGL